MKELRYLHISRQIDKYLDRLRMSGRQGTLAASQYLQILKYFRQAEWSSNVINCKKTKHGEYRLKNCIKYDLGHGHRLITVKDGENLFITFIGNHDQSDRWIETHRHDTFCEDDSLYISETIVTDKIATTDQPPDSLPSPPLIESCEYEAQLSDKIDDAVLKMVFPGFYR